MRLQNYYISGVRRGVSLIVKHNLKIFMRLGITPDRMTASGIGLCLIASFVVLFGKHGSDTPYWVAAAVFFVGSMLDVFDGTLARATGKSTPFGAFVDSVTDRVGEGMMLASINLLFMWQHHYVAGYITGLTILGSVLVSYARAKAEQLNIECRDGIGGRAERCFLIIAGLVFAPIGALPWAIYALAAIAWVTVAQRMMLVRQKLQGRSTLLKPSEEFVAIVAIGIALSTVFHGSPW